MKVTVSPIKTKADAKVLTAEYSVELLLLNTTPATLVNQSAKLLVEDNAAVTTDGDALYLTFSEPVYIKGDLTLKTKNGIANTTGSVTAIDKATATGVDVNGNGKVEGSEKNTIEVTIDLESNATYAFELAKGAVTDLNGNANAEAITFNVASGTFQTAK